MSMCHSECKPQSDFSKAWEPGQEIPQRERERERIYVIVTYERLLH